MKIWINGAETEVDSARLSYEGVCDLANKNPSHNPSCVYFARLGGGLELGGHLTFGNSVELVEGMRFSCMHTGGG